MLLNDGQLSGRQIEPFGPVLVVADLRQIDSRSLDVRPGEVDVMVLFVQVETFVQHRFLQGYVCPLLLEYRTLIYTPDEYRKNDLRRFLSEKLLYRILLDHIFQVIRDVVVIVGGGFHLFVVLLALLPCKSFQFGGRSGRRIADGFLYCLGVYLRQVVRLAGRRGGGALRRFFGIVEQPGGAAGCGCVPAGVASATR